MAQIWINYRRADTGYWVNRLFDYLTEHFGREVQMDIHNIPVGVSIIDIIKENISSSDAILVLMGSNWLLQRDMNGKRRIDNEADFVRIEIEYALSLRKKVIPVLLGDAFMPQTSDLPSEIEELARKQAVRIREENWKEGADQLIAILEERFTDDEAKRVDRRTRGVIISYSHKDEEWKDTLVTQLSVLEVEGLIQVWDDRKIAVGDKWKKKISNAIEDASIAVLLISADFLTSNFIGSEEVPRLLERQKNDGLRVVPIIIRPCAWKLVSWLTEFQVRPKDGRPLSAGNTYQIEQDLADLVMEISVFAA